MSRQKLTKIRTDLLARLVELGYRVTPQRELLLSALGQADKHLSAETLLERVRAVYPRVNKSVVYRNLELLAQLGLISCMDFGQGHVEYEVHHHPHHHHLVCRNCRAMLEIDGDAFADIQRQLLERYGFAAEMDHLALFGLCRKCREKMPVQISHHPHSL